MNQSKRFDVVDFVMRFESGEASDAEALRGFSELIKSGQVWSLQGFYGRTATALIERGYLTRTGDLTEKGQALIDKA